ncbi:MAG: hypothetical protein GX900_06510 [Clostridiaceae bacterium]|jgi:hypothetical protein|nr:hypothetical protein [Clostridiaceae bacterium]
MSNKTQVELNKSEVRRFLQSDDVLNMLEKLAGQARNALGDGYETSPYIGRNRANVAVYAESRQAQSDNLKNNTILKAVGSVKLK